MSAAAVPALACRIALPARYRCDDVLALHDRDPQRIAERVDGVGLRKGIAWRGRPACLVIHFHAGHVVAELALNGAPEAGDAERLQAMARRMLGVDQPVAEFERHHRHHPQLGALIAAQPGMRVPVLATPFEALSWAVTGQQISVRAAVAVRGRLIRAAGVQHSSGLFCYPDAHRLASMSVDALRATGLSRAKADTLRALAREVDRGALPLDDWLAEPPTGEIRARLLEVRGIGPWTIDYTLLRGFGYLDGSLHGDVAVRRGLQRLLASAEAVTPQAARQWLAPFSPWRALVAAHLWKVAADAPP